MAATPVHVLAIDQGTTSTRAIVFDRDGPPVATAQQELRAASTPSPAGSSTIPEESGATRSRRLPGGRWRRPGSTAADIAAIGITNQRETTVLWDRDDRRADRTTPSSGRTGAPPTSAERLRGDGAEAAGRASGPAW